MARCLPQGLVDEVRMDVVPVVFGSGKRYFGSVDAQHLLEDPDVVIQGNRVLTCAIAKGRRNGPDHRRRPSPELLPVEGHANRVSAGRVARSRARA